MEAKLEIRIGGLTFAGEGSQAWLTEQLKFILDTVPKIATMPVATPDPVERELSPRAGGPVSTLASHLNARHANAKQVRRFLATAEWLQRKGVPLSTAAVARALKENHQARLANPADCLNQNVGKGFAEKTADGFFITPDGVDHLENGQ